MRKSNKSKSLLRNSKPLILLPELAVAVGLNESIVLQQLHYWIEINHRTGKNLIDGMYWVYNTYQEWQKQFPFWSPSTIRRTFKNLVDEGFILKGCYNKLRVDQTLWYTIDYLRLNSFWEEWKMSHSFVQNGNIDMSILVISIPENIKKKTSENTQCVNGASCKQDARFAYPLDDDMRLFVERYRDLYKTYFHKEHPPLRREQIEEIVDIFTGFFNQYLCSLEEFESMVISFFDEVNKSNDWHIHHFATPGILQMRAIACGIINSYD